MKNLRRYFVVHTFIFQVKNPIGSRGTNMMLKKRPLLITNNTNAISNQPDTMNHREGVQPLIPSLSAISSDRRPPLISQVNTATKEALNFRSTKISPLLSQNLSKVLLRHNFLLYYKCLNFALHSLHTVEL